MMIVYTVFMILLAGLQIIIAVSSPSTKIDWINYMVAGFVLGLCLATIISHKINN